MKTLKLLVLSIAFLALANCSSNDDGVPALLPTTNSMTIVVDGVTYTFDTFIALKAFDNFEVLASNANQENFYLRFNENGVLDNASFYSSNSGNFYDFTTSFAWSSGMFDLENLVINPQSMSLSGTFNGMIYEEPFVISDGGSRVVESGIFNVTYVNNTAATVDVFLDATVDGESYESMKTSQSGGFFDGSDIALTGYSDKIYDIAIAFNPDNTVAGTYNFSTGNEVEKVLVSKYNPFTEEYTEYETTGTLVIEETVTGVTSYIKGTFELTATAGPNDTKSITNGRFFLLY